jgi:hypothetical protein
LGSGRGGDETAPEDGDDDEDDEHDDSEAADCD